MLQKSFQSSRTRFLLIANLVAKTFCSMCQLSWVGARSFGSLIISCFIVLELLGRARSTYENLSQMNCMQKSHPRLEKTSDEILLMEINDDGRKQCAVE